VNKSLRCIGLALLLATATAMATATATAARAGVAGRIRSPARGVLCDRYLCADEQGVSRRLTQRYLGEKAAARLFSQGGFDRARFTFANGVFCDTKARVCRENRYFGPDGKRSGAVSKKYTPLLFGR